MTYIMLRNLDQNMKTWCLIRKNIKNYRNLEKDITIIRILIAGLLTGMKK